MANPTTSNASAHHDPSPNSQAVSAMTATVSSDGHAPNPPSNTEKISSDSCSIMLQVCREHCCKCLFRDTRGRSLSRYDHAPPPDAEKFSSPRNNIQKRWKKLHGEENWKGLLKPVLDLDLRHTILHYGNMCQATYDGFNRETASKYAGFCLYKKEHFLDKVGLVNGYPYKYRITKYLYGTSKLLHFPKGYLVKSLAPSPVNVEWNWIGYVAVATDEGKEALGRRDIVIAWRGTIVPLEWWGNLCGSYLDLATEVLEYKQKWPGVPKVIENWLRAPKAHEGWLSMYTTGGDHSAKEQVSEEVTRLVDLYKEDEISITITGHSLGGALATLNAVDFAQRPDHYPVTAFVFASPRVGDTNFRKEFHKICKKGRLRLLRISNAGDVVPRVPPWPCNQHVGVELKINVRDSDYLKYPCDLKTNHNLEVYLHRVAGEKERRQPFRLVFDRSIALMNKYSGTLKDRYCVPASWRVDPNKGMVQKENEGTWEFEDAKPEYFIDYTGRLPWE